MPLPYAEEFSGRKIVLTGACGVIGRWIAMAFAEAGARLCLTDRRPEALERLAAELPGDDHIIHRTELTDERSIASLIDFVVTEWRAPELLINNAGIYPSGFLLDAGATEWDRIMDINLRAPFLLSQGLAKAMIAARCEGNIINISSGASRKMRRSVVPYCVSKSALDRLTKGLALELAEYSIRVNAVEPGFAAGSEVSPLSEDHVRSVISAIPLGRASQPLDAPAAIAFLASSGASYITGATLAVDGGNSIGSLEVHQQKKQAL